MKKVGRGMKMREKRGDNSRGKSATVAENTENGEKKAPKSEKMPQTRAFCLTRGKK